MQNKTLWIGIGVALAILVAGVVLLGKGAKKAPETTQNQVVLTPTPTPGSTNELSPATGEVKEITVTANEYSFTPASLSLKKGEKVRLTFINAGKFPHNLTIDELNVATKTIAGGSQDVIEFVANEGMDVKFYCSVGGHRAQGMEGTLKVE